MYVAHRLLMLSTILSRWVCSLILPLIIPKELLLQKYCEPFSGNHTGNKIITDDFNRNEETFTYKKMLLLYTGLLKYAHCTTI